MPLLFSQAAAQADTLYLKNGRSIEGIIKSEDDRNIWLEVNSGIVGFEKEAIAITQRAFPGQNSSLRQEWERERAQTERRIAEQKLQEERAPKKVHFSQESQSIVVRALLNSRVEAALLLDTGASLVLLRKDIAGKLGIKLEKENPDIKLTLADGRQVSAKYIVLESVKVEEVEAKNVEAAVITEEVGALGPAGDGLLGMSFLKKFNFKVDHKDKKLILEKLE